MSGPQRAATRPLSPHLQIWRYHVTMLASITHRITGAALYFGTFLIAAWLVALAISPDAFAAMQGIITSIPGKIILFLWAVAVMFHLFNGIRHLVWDGPGIGFSPKVASTVSTIIYFLAILGAVALMFAAGAF
ncbi:succinate dehydrogenase, cytochrome b556 subunit [Hyphomonas sp. NPDC076900]|uniref:Succinate dehydrogenase cytochrome b556 subunit n=1 Tax=Hyphomonas polymorpha PS728 TaxID=1280954 RepID=A0A062VDP5_9PROT|nr:MULTISPECIES: succinate dehydrogenase, cytochrome b556 subunit [Hyphomonas]AXE65654.1 succinate dehydrogenase, cytochrome b556 subunit [Hyphomonas sp. CACIAM 19H1]KCZ96593.1 succinate dehydrogenase, cytochrome b556 subunit [Hyphomonas polymorpha PS728]